MSPAGSNPILLISMGLLVLLALVAGGVTVALRRRSPVGSLPFEAGVAAAIALLALLPLSLAAMLLGSAWTRLAERLSGSLPIPAPLAAGGAAYLLFVLGLLAARYATAASRDAESGAESGDRVP